MYKQRDLNQHMQWLRRLLNVMAVCMFHGPTSKILRDHIASWLSVHPCVCVSVCQACCILGTMHYHILIYHQNYLKLFIDSLCVFLLSAFLKFVPFENTIMLVNKIPIKVFKLGA